MKIAIISDIHSNFIALKEVLREIKKKKIKKIFCAGDIIGYASMPNECIKELIKNNIKSIYGNHEFVLLNFQYANLLNYQALKALIWHKENLENFAWRWIKKLKEKLILKIGSKKIMIFHGSPENCFEYIWPDTSKEIFEYWLKKYNVDILIFGHTHIPFIKNINSKLVINPGSIGQPRDGNNKASFCIIDLENLEAKIFRKIYDINKIAEDIKQKGLPRIFADRLYLGK
ncbi:MAG: YfcE family phosphodiesterase [Candidatus Pacearchaeota archaeon]